MLIWALNEEVRTRYFSRHTSKDERINSLAEVMLRIKLALQYYDQAYRDGSMLYEELVKVIATRDGLRTEYQALVNSSSELRAPTANTGSVEAPDYPLYAA